MSRYRFEVDVRAMGDFEFELDSDDEAKDFSTSEELGDYFLELGGPLDVNSEYIQKFDEESGRWRDI